MTSETLSGESAMGAMAAPDLVLRRPDAGVETNAGNTYDATMTRVQ